MTKVINIDGIIDIINSSMIYSVITIIITVILTIVMKYVVTIMAILINKWFLCIFVIG